MLNWICMVGAMHELGQKVEMVNFIESYLMNSSKCVALFPPRPVAAASEQELPLLSKGDIHD